jgi:carboxyl-terminal processing protease
MSRIFFFCLILCFYYAVPTEARLPAITAVQAREKIQEIMGLHATHKQLTPELVRRSLNLYLEQIDPLKSYLIESDISLWLNPSDAEVQTILNEYNNNSFASFDAIDGKMRAAIERHRILEAEINTQDLPKNVRAEEFKDMEWTHNDAELKTRLARLRALQIETAGKLSPELQAKLLQRISKRQAKFEEEFLDPDAEHRERHTLSNVIKAVAASLDAHSSYFTPDEARQFLINVQQRLFGIGAQLRDDLNGFSVVKIIEGGPAAEGKLLRVKDRIIAVDGEPVIGMDILDAVELIRGEKNTSVILTVIRTEGEGDQQKEVKLDLEVKRGEVVLKESRYEASFEPFGDGGIAYLRLYSFYQDPEFSSAADLSKALEKIKKEHNVYGVILDLRYNAGGMLTQAVNVASLFISKGIVVSIKDENGKVQHLRDIDGVKVWDGALVVLINRASASASEIVAQTLQDYGRALVVGDEHSYGKGSFQTFTLNPAGYDDVNPQGEYKVTRGRYYTVSGKSPQLEGVRADIVVPGVLSATDIGEKTAKYPLESDYIPPSFVDDLSDVPFAQRSRMRLLYKFNLQQRLTWDAELLSKLRYNSNYRVEHNKAYQTFLKDLKKQEEGSEADSEPGNESLQMDFQLQETYNIMRDLVIFKGVLDTTVKPAEATIARPTAGGWFGR